MVTRGRFFSTIIWANILNCLLIGTSCAGFWGGDDKGKSGLDFNRGYDINTVSTISGRAVSAPYTEEKKTLIVEIRNGTENLYVIVGPRSYWDKKGISINANDDLLVKGSKAQGQDGKSYLLAQKLLDRTTGSQVELRNEKGEPGWSGISMSRSQGPAGSMRNQGGGMMRSGGGGGMMRR